MDQDIGSRNQHELDVMKILFTALSILNEQREKRDSVEWTCGFWPLLWTVLSQNLNKKLCKIFRISGFYDYRNPKPHLSVILTHLMK